MQSCIGIPIPPALRAEIAAFCRERRYTPTELFIELIPAQQLATVTDLSSRLQAFARVQQTIQVVVAGPNCQGNRLLYLTVLPGSITILRDRMAKHLGLLPDGIYRPLLPVIRQYPGHFIDLDRYLEEARQSFTRPFPITVNSVTLYSQASPQYPFRPSVTLPLLV